MNPSCRTTLKEIKKIIKLSPPLQDGIQEVDWNVELEREGEEYRERHHYLHQDSQAEVKKIS